MWLLSFGPPRLSQSSQPMDWVQRPLPLHMLLLAHVFLCLSWWRASRTIDAADSPPCDNHRCCRAEWVHYLWIVSSPSFNDNDNGNKNDNDNDNEKDNDGSYEPFSSAGDDGYSVLRCPVTFDANVDPTFDLAWAVDEDKERRLDDEHKLWFNKRVVGQDRDK